MRKEIIKEKSEKSEMRWCKDIGMHTIDRSRLSCVHATTFCKKNCFNKKLYKCYKSMAGKDTRNDKYWIDLKGSDLKAELDKKAKSRSKRLQFTDRVRYMSRGEAISNKIDILKIISHLNANPGRIFWLPTRAWRNAELKTLIERILFRHDNVRILASLDPSNTQKEIDSLINAGWSTMFFGDDERPAIKNSYKCPKTWEHKKGICSTCSKGCFKKKQTHVWLKMH